ncbi:MAG: tail fiber protein [Cytophagales bacterium]|nr:tail fiber protein [Cytophagales bacterium]
MDSFLGLIYLSAISFAPRQFAFCSGQIIPVTSNSALFALLGTNFGGNGRTTFGIPDFRGRVPVGSNNMGVGPGLSVWPLGELFGFERVTLSVSEIPAHNHGAIFSGTGGSGADAVSLSTAAAVREVPQNGDVPAVANFGSGLGVTNVKSFGPDSSTVNGQVISTGGTPAGSVTVDMTGGSESHYNIQPSQAINYIIAVEGIFPSRN